MFHEKFPELGKACVIFQVLQELLVVSVIALLGKAERLFCCSRPSGGIATLEGLKRVQNLLTLSSVLKGDHIK